MPVTVGELVPNLAAFEEIRTSPQMVAAMRAIVEEAKPVAQSMTPVADGSDSRYTRPNGRKPGTAQRSIKAVAGVADVEGIGPTAMGRLYSGDYVFRFIQSGTVNQPPRDILGNALRSTAVGAQVRD